HRKPAHMVTELLFRTYVRRFRIAPLVEREANADQWIGGPCVIVERDDPEPSPFEGMMHGAVDPGHRRQVSGIHAQTLIGGTDADHVRKQRSRMVFEGTGLFTKRK